MANWVCSLESATLFRLKTTAWLRGQEAIQASLKSVAKLNPLLVSRTAIIPCSRDVWIANLGLPQSKEPWRAKTMYMGFNVRGKLKAYWILTTCHLFPRSALYGYAPGSTWPRARQLTESLLEMVTTEIILGGHGPRIVGGDFNVSANGLSPFCSRPP